MNTFIRILSFTKPYKITVFIAFIASFFYGLFNAISLWVVGSLIDTIMGSGKINTHSNIIEQNNLIDKLGNYFEQILNNANSIDRLKIVCLCLFASFILKNLFYYINWIAISLLELNIIKDIRNILYEKVQNFPLSFFNKNKSGEILSIMLNDINWITIAFNKTFQVFFHEFISMLILFFMLFMISSKLTLLVLFTAPISAYIIIKIGQSIRRKAKRASHKISDISSIITEKTAGISIVKAFNMTTNEISKFFNANNLFFKLQFNQKKLLGLTTPVNDIIGVSLAAILLWYGGQQVLLDSSLSSDDFLRFIIFLFALLQPARKLGSGVAAIQSGIAGADRVFNILDMNFNKKNNSDLKNIKNFKNYIEFKNVNFNYNHKTKVLQNINVKINKGEKIALVGRSGSGKTTFSNLLLDFYQPNSGSIIIDDSDYKKVTSTSLRNIIGLVSQEPILFNDSIRNNIMYGMSNLDNNDKMINAAKIANIKDFIESLPNKYEEIIGEGGNNLSGGQKQRLSIARSIVKDPPILILDEATSSLDSESEMKVQKAIDNLLKDRTVIMIAHRLSTIRNADKILVFDNGEIVGEGKHDELINSNDIYSNLYKLQFNIDE
tara:strand:- start:506 stop:2329 length:1824 start_codon:yes stop_codon:yes gene_type:complete